MLDSTIVSETNHGNVFATPMSLELEVCDPEVVAELESRPQGNERDRFALSALRVGVLALRQAGGIIDTDRFKAEGERVLQELRDVMCEQGLSLTAGITREIGRYLDPETGDFTTRLNSLVRKDGDLEQILARHLDGDTSIMGQTLAEFLGERSPLLKHLSPSQSDGFLASLKAMVQEALRLQTQGITCQFSLDNKDSALSRMITEITDNNGRLRSDLAGDISVLRKEFSLDQPDSALSRLVKEVETTTAQVQRNLTLDDDSSPMARLRREIVSLIEGMKQANANFHAEVCGQLQALSARRAEAARSIGHGIEFEQLVGDFLSDLVRNSGNVLEHTGHSAGKNQRCKLGDYVLTVGSENTGAGCCIVFEAKEDKSYDLKSALSEIAQARENREAQVGVFVFSRATAPDGIENLARYGSDVVVVWDREDVVHDAVLKAAFLLALCMIVRERARSEQVDADFDAIEDAVRRIAKSAESLEEIGRWAGTVRTNGDKIRNRAEKMAEEIGQQLEVLRANMETLRAHASKGEAG
jgi:hypothetical protein